MKDPLHFLNYIFFTLVVKQDYSLEIFLHTYEISKDPVQ